MIELLSPVGDFECLKAAIQNGADCVYFGANIFSARASAKNFNLDELEQAINYAKIRGVKTNLTLNTLIKNNEMNKSFELAKKAYEFGIDAIIVQDLGLASLLIKSFPDLAIHASTQMSVHNLEGVKKLEQMGFKRVVLSRELSSSEIEYICKNSNVEIECFIHGALCISYSGQCLFSSMIGGRSGNRGRCAQPCRLPYTLLENDVAINKGYLLSPRDLCGLEYLPFLINSGVTCLKIEGRMKTPDYVATVTKIYRKYIDLILENKPFIIDEKDKKDLMQVFNRGGFSTGHLNVEANKKLIFKEKPNNMGIFLGTVSKFNNYKGLVSLSLKDDVYIGDKISISTSKEDAVYTISELMINDKNIPSASTGNNVKIGRMKGNIQIGDKIYKISSKELSDNCKITYSGQEIKKRNLCCNITIKKDKPITISVNDDLGHIVKITSDILPVDAISSPITKERIISQISKTNNTPFVFKNINIDLDENLYIPSISKLNELRRNALSEYENVIINSFKRSSNTEFSMNFKSSKSFMKKKISLLLNILDSSYDYTKIQNADRIYIPLKYFFNNKFKDVLDSFNNLYIYLPCIMKNNYINIFNSKIDEILNTYTNIKGFVISNIGQFELVNKFSKKYDLIANYNLNLYNNKTAEILDVSTVTLSPELSKETLENISADKNSEIIVYGKTPVMNSNYCLLGDTNKCYKECSKKCMENNKYYLKDRMGFTFRIIPDNIDTITTIYNSKITFIDSSQIYSDYARIDIIDEDIAEINNIINCVLNGNKLEGKDYTNGNFKKEV